MRNYKAICLLVLLFTLACGSYAQSLGDVARQQRQKQQAKDPKAAPRSLPTTRSRSHPTPRKLHG